MPLSGGTAGAHDDAMHQDSAKRDAVNGVAGLSVDGNVLSPGEGLFLTRNVGNNIQIRERTSGELVIHWVRNAANDYFAVIQSGGVDSIIQLANMKDVANGIAGLDVNTKVTARLAYEDIANGVAGLDASAKIPHGTLRVGSHRAEHVQKIVSANLRHSHDSEDAITSGAWAKYKTITLTNGISGVLRIKHTSYCENGGAGATYTRVYKNGAALGGIKANTTNASYVEYSEDLNVGDMQPGETLELWAYDGGYPDSRSVKNFRLYYDNELLIGVASSNS